MTILKNYQALTPKLISVLKEGYTWPLFGRDVLSGLTVAIVALPLAMALAIASGAKPEDGLITAIVAGFIISAMGGSRYQIGGPTAAFIVVVLNVITDHGYDGMLLATLMAGLMLILAGFLRLGNYIKYVPYPVITGFTAGIAATILVGQLKDLLGFNLSAPPRDSVELLAAYAGNISGITGQAALMGLGLLGLMLLIRRYRPKWPVFLIGVGLGGVLVWLGQYLNHPLSVATIGSRFGALPTDIAWPHLPAMNWDKIKEMFPSALTIAFLAGVEALLSAVVADGMTGRRHRSNIELIAQGTANCASSMFGGLPATGAIARTATNIRAGAYSPVSGILHAAFLLIFMQLLAPLASFVPLCALSAVLVIVAWNISEVERFRHLMKAPRGDRMVLITTFLLTFFIDLTVAIKVGIVMAALLFMHRMAELVDVGTVRSFLHDGADDDAAYRGQTTSPVPDDLPEGIEVYQISGPFFFGAANRVSDELGSMRKPPKVFILRVRDVPLIDSSGAFALQSLCEKIARQGGEVILTGLQPQPRKILEKMSILGREQRVSAMPDFRLALEEAKRKVAASA